MKPAYGYIFATENIKVGFTGDTTICKNVEYMASVCNYLFCDCTLIKGDKKHMGIDMIITLNKKYPDCKFIVSHLDDSTRKELEKGNIKNIIISEDNYTFNILK